MIDRLPQLMPSVNQQLNKQQAKPVVIYAHCEVWLHCSTTALTCVMRTKDQHSNRRLQAGTDRTGEFSASYYMMFQNMTLAQSIQLDEQISGRDMHRTERWATEWFCWYLVAALSYNLTCNPVN
jgi:hypothetical protein